MDIHPSMLTETSHIQKTWFFFSRSNSRILNWRGRDPESGKRSSRPLGARPLSNSCGTLLMTWCIQSLCLTLKSSSFRFFSPAYGLGLLVTFAGLYLMAIAQPALLYLVPFTLIPVFVLGLVRHELKDLWNGDGQVIFIGSKNVVDLFLFVLSWLSC